MEGGLNIKHYGITKNKTSYIKSTIIAISIVSLLSTSCSSKQSSPAPQQQSAQTEQKFEKTPDQLNDIESSIEKIIKSLNGPSVGIKEDEANKEPGKSEKTDASQGDKNKQTGQDSQSSKEPEKQQSAGKEQKPSPQPEPPAPVKDPFDSVVSTLSALHYQWNSYMPLAMKEGANKSLIDGFSNSLNNLTNNAMTKNRMNTLLAASSLYSYVPDFQSLYKTKVSPELKKMRHYIRNALLNSMTSNWAQSDHDISSLKSSWSFFKASIPKEQQDLSSKLELSIYEFERVIKERNQSLSEIKGKIALSNTEELEKALKGP